MMNLEIEEMLRVDNIRPVNHNDVIFYLNNNRIGDEGYVFRFEDFDEISINEDGKYVSQGSMTINVSKLTYEIIKSKILAGDVYCSGAYPYIVEKVFREVLRLAPYVSEDVIKEWMVTNRGDMIADACDIPYSPALEEWEIRRLDINASKCGKRILPIYHMTTLNHLIRKDLCCLNEFKKIDDRLKVFLDKYFDEYLNNQQNIVRKRCISR